MVAAVRLFIIGLIISTTSICWAQNKSPYEVHPEYEIPITVGLFAAAGVPRLFADELQPSWCGLECDPNQVNSFDRTAIGWNSGTARTVSDVTFISGMVLPHVAGAFNAGFFDPIDGWEGYGKDTLVLMETMSFTLAMNNILDIAVKRPRPLVYDASVPEEERRDSNSAFSFPSGHTAVVFALGTAYSRLYMQRHPDSPWVVPVWIGSYSLGVVTGVTRVLAGEHFWTDVLAGVGLGVGSGLLIPWIHEPNEDGKHSAFRPKFSPLILDRGAGLTISMSN